MKRREVGYAWHLRQVMASRGLFSTSDLQPLLAERGVDLSVAQIYRFVAQPPERLNMRVLAAVCDALECTPNDLIEPTAATTSVRARAAGGARTRPAADGPERTARPTRVQVVRPE